MAENSWILNALVPIESKIIPLPGKFGEKDIFDRLEEIVKNLFK